LSVFAELDETKITFTTTVAIWIARLPMDHVKAYAFAAG